MAEDLDKAIELFREGQASWGWLCAQVGGSWASFYTSYNALLDYCEPLGIKPNDVPADRIRKILMGRRE